MKTINNSLLIAWMILLSCNLGKSQALCDNGTLQSPCYPIIPSNVLIINSDTDVFNANAVCYWVCEGVTLFLNEVANCQAYGEAGSTIRLLGGENYIWMLEGGEVQIDAGAQFNWVRRVSNSVLVDNGNLTMDLICNPLTYDRPVDLPNACLITSIEEPGFSNFKLILTPNPADKEVFIQTQVFNNEKVDVTLIDTEGRKVKSQTIFWNNGHNLDLHSLNNGLYFIIVQNQMEKYSARILVAH